MKLSAPLRMTATGVRRTVRPVTAIGSMGRYAEKIQVTLNGLAIIDDHPELESSFQYRVITGPGTFVITANDYAAYGGAIRRKLPREIIKPIS